MNDNKSSQPSLTCSDCRIPLKKGKDKWFCPECGYSVSFSCASQLPDKAIVAEDARLSLSAELSNLPSIIAIPLKEYYTQPHPRFKLWTACEIVEYLLRLLVAIGLSEIKEMNAESLPAEMMSEINDLIEEPTLGKWKSMAVSVAKQIVKIKDRSIAPQIIDTVEKIVPFLDGNPGNKTVETSFSKIRNTMAHSGLTETLAEKYFGIWKDRFEKIIADAAWLGGIAFVVRGENGKYSELKGCEKTLPDYNGDASKIGEKFRTGKEIVIVRNEKALTLWPLALYGLPKIPETESDLVPKDEISQVYVRRGNVLLEYTPIGSDEVCQSINDDEKALGEFEKLFKSIDGQKRKYEVPGFEAEIKKDAGLLIGREKELEKIRTALSQTESGVIWLTGKAGIGKSFLMAGIAQEKIAEKSDDLIVLPYRFKVGNPYCSKNKFTDFAIERLDEWAQKVAGAEKEDEKSRNSKSSELILRELFQKLIGKKILFILDGLDEIAEADKSFADDVIFKFSGTDFPGVIWLCAGRADRGMSDIFTEARCKYVYPKSECPDGIPKMCASDIRAMILEKIGPLRKRLVREDKEIKGGQAIKDGDAVVNPFIDRVERNAEGNPLYVKYLIGDILENKIRAFSDAIDLPKSLNDYHAKLLARLGIGTLNQVMTPLAATIAVSKEPLDFDTIFEILDFPGNILPGDEDKTKLLKTALDNIQSMIRRAKTSDDKDGYTLYHHSLRQFMEKSADQKGALSTARENLCRFMMNKNSWQSKAANYMLRWGVCHLIDANKWDDVERILTDLEFIDAKCVAGMTYELVEDYKDAIANLPDEDAREKIKKEKEHQEKIKKYVDDLIKYSGDPDNNPLPHIDSVKIMTDEEIDAKIERLKNANDLTRLERIEEFSRFVNGSAHEFAKFAVGNPKFCIQQAYNSSEGGMVEENAGSIIKTFKKNALFLLKSGCRQPYNSRPAFCRTLDGHISYVAAISVSLNGKIALSGSDDKTICVWDLPTGKCIRLLEGHTKKITSVAIMPDGKMAVSGSEDKTVRVWDIESGDCLYIFEDHNDRVNSVAIIPNGKFAVSGSDDKTLRVWNLVSGKRLSTLEGHSNYVTSVAITPDGKMAVSGSWDKTVRVWDIRSYSCLSKFEGHTDYIDSVAVSPDGKTLASGSRDKTVRVWDITSAGCVREFKGHSDFISSVVFVPDCKTVVSGSWDKTLRVWDKDSGDCIRIIEEHSDRINSIAITADGRSVLSGSSDKTIRVWNVASGKSLQKLEEHSSDISSIVIRPEKKIVASGSYDKTIRIWDATSCKCIRKFSGHTYWINSVAFTVDGKYVLSASSDKTIRAWSVETGLCTGIFEGHTSFVNSIAATSDGKTLISGSNDKTIRVWDISSCKCLRVLEGHTGSVHFIALLSDNKTAVSCSWDRTLRLWDYNTGECLKILAGHTSRINSFAITPDGKTLVSASGECEGDDNTLRVWNIVAGECVQILSGHTNRINSVIVIPGGKKIISAAGEYEGNDNTLRMWDLESYKCVRVFKGHASSVNVVAATPDGNTILSGSADKTLRIWKSSSNECSLTVPFSSSVNSISLRNGILVVGEGGGRINFIEPGNFML